MKALVAAAALAATTLFVPLAYAGDVPTGDEARKVAAYYYDGKDAGPVLVRSLACTKIEDKDPKTKNECVAPIVGSVPKGTFVSAWTDWLVPIGGKYDDITVQFLLDGAIRETKDVELTEGLRYRVWRSSTLTKAGKWTIKVQRAGKDLSSIDFEVK